MTYEVKKIRKYSKGWLVYIQTTSLACGCNVKPIIITFEQEKEPTEEEIRKRYESKS